MATFRTADELLDRIQGLNSPYSERAFLFVLAALEYCQRCRPKRGHISGQELALACRDFATEQFGLTARAVLEFWGITTTTDIGKVVFALVDLGLLMKQDSDTIEAFEGVFDFETAFDTYPWRGAKPAGNQA